MSPARSAPDLDPLEQHVRAAEAALARARRRLTVLQRELTVMAPFLSPAVTRQWALWAGRTAKHLEARAQAARAVEAWLCSYLPAEDAR
jgi:hypothetical protein